LIKELNKALAIELNKKIKIMTAIEFSHQLVSLESKLSRFAYSLTSNRDDAKDLLQDTFVRAIAYKDHYEENTNLQAWTFTIMKNSFINNYRRNIRHSSTFDYSKDLLLLSQNKDHLNVTPESAFSAREIMELIEKLDEDFRVPFKMHVEGFKYKEIAKKMKLNIGTVKSRIFFARKKLIMALKEKN
jgi:RNA polymerase sigma-70 factor, ECF subfamily